MQFAAVGRMQFAAVFLVIKGVQQVAVPKHRGATFSDLLQMPYSAILSYPSQPPLVYTSSRQLFMCVLLCLAACMRARTGWLTFLCFRLVGSQMDPWHMVASSVQYTLLAPSYINILNV